MGLAGTRLVFRRGKFSYIHREGNRWEDVGTDLAEAKRIANQYNNPGDGFGTMAYWFQLFLDDFKLLVKSKKRSQRTLDDYTGYFDKDGPLVASFGKMFPERVLPVNIQTYIEQGAELERAVQANRERAALSSCISWLIRNGKVPTLVVNPCMEASGIVRNGETPRQRYVTHEEYRAVYDAANRAVRLAMELEYRTLQRPEVDILGWTAANVKKKDGGKVLHFQQNKTKRWLDIALVGEFGALVDEAIGTVPKLHQPILHTLAGEAYTYDGISSMLRQAQDKVRDQHFWKRGPLADMKSFGLRDLKGKGATDMWRAGVPLEQIQHLCGHASKVTTEKYVKARWLETAQPNLLVIGS